ncbi:MAG: TfpX/TfpZ family type IV pilin accessory protein [Pseudomonadota bacterium]
MIPWREKWRAFAIHFAVTLVFAAGAAAIIFGAWFPDPFDTLIGGAELFVLVVGCDLVLGPLLSLVIWDSRKGRGKLVFDYCVVGVIQIAALVYGVWIVAGSRPVYVAFVGDRLEVVTARDIRPDELAAARDPIYRSPPLTGPRLVAVVVPPAERTDALFQALDGNEEQSRPKFFVPYESQLSTIQKHIFPLADLEKRHPEGKEKIAAARASTGLPDSQLRWMPLRYREAFWTVLVDAGTGRPLEYFDLDPY